MLEDQQAAQLAWQQQPQDPGVPYEARRGRHSGHRGVHPTNAPAAGERDAVGEFQEGFNRFADSMSYLLFFLKIFGWNSCFR